MKVIRASLEHVDVIAALFDQYRRFYGQIPDRPGATAFLAERLRRQQSVVFLALDEAVSPSAGAGFVQLYPSFSSVSMKPIWILNDLFVPAKARRHGVARLLMDAALGLARSTGAIRLELSTAKDNLAAKALYLGLGYQLDVQFDHLELPVR